MADARTRHLRRLNRLRRAARRWTVAAGGFAGAAAVLVPYHGLGLPDAVWTAAAGGAAVLAGWRWTDYRAVAARPTPPPADPALAAQRLTSAIVRLPGGAGLVDEVRRQQARLRLRGSTVAPLWVRLDRASATLSGLAVRLTGGPAAPALDEATVAERSLRELAERAATVERALSVAPPDAREPLQLAHADLIEQVNEGVEAYERLVAAAAGYVAEDGRTIPAEPAVGRLREATDLLRGVASGLSELRTVGPVS